MPRKKAVVEEEEDVEALLDELDDEELEDEDEDVEYEDEDEEELDDEDVEDEEDEEDPDEAPKARRRGKPAAKGKRSGPKRELPKYGTSWLADRLGIAARQLRILLRAEYPKEGGNYSWTGPSDPEVKAITERVKRGAKKDATVKKATVKKTSSRTVAKKAPAKTAGRRTTAKSSTRTKRASRR